jgi:hypothetical protein
MLKSSNAMDTNYFIKPGILLFYIHSFEEPYFIDLSVLESVLARLALQL